MDGGREEVEQPADRVRDTQGTAPVLRVGRGVEVDREGERQTGDADRDLGQAPVPRQRPDPAVGAQHARAGEQRIDVEGEEREGGEIERVDGEDRGDDVRGERGAATPEQCAGEWARVRVVARRISRLAYGLPPRDVREHAAGREQRDEHVDAGLLRVVDLHGRTGQQQGTKKARAAGDRSCAEGVGDRNEGETHDERERPQRAFGFAEEHHPQLEQHEVERAAGARADVGQERRQRILCQQPRVGLVEPQIGCPDPRDPYRQRHEDEHTDCPGRASPRIATSRIASRSRAHVARRCGATGRHPRAHRRDRVHAVHRAGAASGRG